MISRRSAAPGPDNITCRACGSSATLRIGTIPDSRLFAGTTLAEPLSGGDLIRCTHCRLRFRHPVFTPADYEALYDNARQDVWEASATRTDWRLLTSFLEKRFAGPFTVLDVGCYSGDLLAWLGNRADKYGVEVNQAAAAVARTRNGIKTFRSLAEIPGPVEFDAVILCDVIEHFPDPGALVLGLLGRLRAGGVIVVTTGDAENWLWALFRANWWYCAMPEHISFVSIGWLTRFVAERPDRLSLLQVERFCYLRLSPVQYAGALLKTVAFGVMPRLFNSVDQASRRALGRPEVRHPAGSGLTKDHFFFALEKS